jgi:hypothetical protein
VRQYDFGLPGLTSISKPPPHALHSLDRNTGHNLPSTTNEQGCGQIRALFHKFYRICTPFARAQLTPTKGIRGGNLGEREHALTAGVRLMPLQKVGLSAYV